MNALEFVDQVAPAPSPALAVTKGDRMFERPGFLFVLYAVEVLVIAALVVGLRASYLETRDQIRELLWILVNDRNRARRGARGGALSAAGIARLAGRVDLARRYRAFCGRLRAIRIGRSPNAGRPAEPCVLCGAATVAGARLVCRFRGGPIHVECIPAIVRSSGPVAVVRWLHLGTYDRGKHERESRIA